MFQGEQVGAGKKSLAYHLTYQAPDRTLTDAEAAQIRQKIIRRLEQDHQLILRLDLLWFERGPGFKLQPGVFCQA